MYCLVSIWISNGTLFFMHDVVVSTLLAIYNSHVLHVRSVLSCSKNLCEIKCCVRFCVPRDPVMTLLPV